ncbi:hypothetical protein ACFWFX_15475 [Streptomyces roseolus]|uniref:hypothetical protein n=1 Tax=Streptomyces roseolus TaxID=67358 RepID=UPI00366087ED
MIVIVGSQSSEEDRGELQERAGFLGAVPMHPDVDWLSVQGFVILPGWERCPTALADHAAASALGLPIEYLN